MTRPFDAGCIAFYRDVLEALNAGEVPFLVGGAFAFNAHTGIERDTKDLDLFIRRADYEQAGAVLGRAGHAVELTFPHWLAKVRRGECLVDLIFSSGNGLAEVDDEWFAHAGASELLGVPVKTAPVEEAIWSKAFVMERERYDGADVAHLLLAEAGRMDWARLVRRFGPHWRVLLAHLLLFGFVYPGERARVPRRVLDELLQRLHAEPVEASEADVCRGTLLSREQYLPDIEQCGMRDARVAPLGPISAEQVAHWTRAIDER